MSQKQEIFPETIVHKTFETNSSFHMKQQKVLFLFFKGFLVVLAKYSFWQGDWALGYHSMGFSTSF